MRAITVCVLLAASALAQKPAPPAFEVASVKIQADPAARSAMDVQGGNLTFRNVTMRMLLSWAYDIQWAQIAGPAWLDTERYEVIAKAGETAEPQLKAMLQTLLAERFQIRSHRETRQTEVMALTVPKGGHKMTPSKAEKTSSRQDPVRGTVLEGVMLADLCSDMTHDRNSIPVLDQTGLTGRWDFAFNIQKYRDALRSRAMSSPTPVSDAELRLGFSQDLLKGELGLNVELKKAPVEFLVLDKIEQTPVRN